VIGNSWHPNLEVSFQPNDDTSVKAECANDNTTANSCKKKKAEPGMERWHDESRVYLCCGAEV
jgi:hypothetical protein